MKPVINVLHLPHRTDRARSIIKESQEQGFDIRWWEGERAESRKDAKRAICTGHKRIIQYAKDEGLPSIIVGEDDLIFFAPGAFKYFVDSIPNDYDLFMAVIYNGSLEPETFRVLNGFSGGMSLYVCHERFYDFILNEVPDDCHIDRFCGDHSHRHKYYQCNPIVGHQSGGVSDNLRKVMYYDAYLEGRSIFGRD